MDTMDTNFTEFACKVHIQIKSVSKRNERLEKELEDYG